MIFTSLLIVVGVGVVLYNLGVILEAVTEGRLRQHLGRLRMEHDISATARATSSSVASAGSAPQP